MSHEHGPPSVDLGTVRWIVRGLWALVLGFVLIDAVWFGPSWLSSLGSHEAETHQPAGEEHSEPSHTGAHPTPEQPAEHHGDPSASEDHSGFGGHKHGHYAFEMVPAFHAVYGFAGCVGLVLAARVLRMLVMRDEDYYGDDAPFQPPSEPADQEGHHA